MLSPKEIKEKKVSEFQEMVSESKATILIKYKGLTVHDMEELRGKLREVGGRLNITKNTLAKVAINNLGIMDLDDDLNGQVAFIFSNTDAVMGTKVANNFSRQKDNFKIISGYFDGNRLSVEEVKHLANLPSREELQSRLVGILMAPLVDLVGTLTATIQEFIGTLDSRAAKVEEDGETQAA